MNDLAIIGLFGLVAVACGTIGGQIAAAVVLWARTRWPKLFLGQIAQEYELPVTVILRADAVQLPIRVQQPEPVTVAVVTTGAPTTRELAARVIAQFPTVGPTDLAAICQCAKSTAHAILSEARAGTLSLPAPVEDEN